MASGMKVKLWGVRGSIPSPGPETVRYGGNTSCISIEFDDVVLIFDAGSGIRALGKALLVDSRPIVIYLTHLHWDHVQGLLFFAPIHQPGRTIALVTPDRSIDCLSTIAGVDGIHFPLTPEQIASSLRINEGDPDVDLGRRGIAIRRLRMNHPGVCEGFRVDYAGRSFVYIPDNEISPPEAGPLAWDDLVAFCRGADVLVHDAQYIPKEIVLRRGWGHSLMSEACRLGVAAGVGRLILFHHDPERTDAALSECANDCKAFENGTTTIVAAEEGMVFDFGSQTRQ